MLKRLIFEATLASLALVLSVAPRAFADSVKRIEVPAGDLVAALEALAKQADIELVYQAEQLRGIRTQGLNGAYEPKEAVSLLIKGTRLVLRTDEATGVMMISATKNIPVSSATIESRGMELAQAGISSVASGENGQSMEGRKSSLVPTGSQAESRSTIQEITVTAQKREERLIDVPISIVAMSADEMKQRKVTSLDDLGLAVPGLAIESSGSYSRRIMLRGISNSVGSSLIGLYLDEVAVTSGSASQLDLRTYDLERVEVLRGPQGTLYGEGSVGGTIRFITKNPVLDRFGMNADVTGLFTEDGAPGYLVEGMLNVPLIENKLGLRIAGTYGHEGGWVDQPAANRQDINDSDLVNVRVKGLWKPVPQFTVNATALIHRNDAPANIGEDANGNITQTFNLTTVRSGKDAHDLYSLTMAYDFGAVQLLSASGYIRKDIDVRDLGYRLFRPVPLDAYIFQDNGVDVFNEELRLSSTASGPYHWTIGGFYRSFRSQSVGASQAGVPIAPNTPLPNPFFYRFGSESESWAAFGDANYEVTSRITLGTGLRYFEEKQKATSAYNGVPFPSPTGSFNSVNPRVYAQYKFTRDINAYVSAAKGFRSGGLNSLGQPNFAPESVWTYEVGTKMSVANGRLDADAAVFYSDYTDYQIRGILPPPAPLLSIYSNAGNARVRGIELALSVIPAEQWSLTFNGTYVDSEMVEINATSTAYAVGDPLDLFPKYAYTVSTQRDFNWSSRQGFIRLDYNQKGRSHFRNRTFGPAYHSESDIINMLNLNMSIQWNDALSLTVFAQNLLNDRGFVSPNWVEEFAARSRPRNYGIGFGVKF